MDNAEADKTKSNWRLILTVLTLIALVVLIYALRHQIEEVINNIGQVNTVALFFMIPLQFINYDSYTRLYRDLFKTLGNKVKYWPLYKINLELNFVNHILPSGGVSGISYFSVRMRSEGISAAKSTLAQVMKLFLLYVSFQPLLIIGVFLLALRGHANNLIILVASSLITLLVVGTFAGVYMIESKTRINAFLTTVTKGLNRLIHLVRRQHPETISIYHAQQVFHELHDNYQIFKNNLTELKKPFLYMTIANITEIASLYAVYIAFGQYVNIGAVILAYAVANFAGLISVLPAGIGIYEGLMTAVLAATGIPAKISIPVTLMYRIINMFIQLLPGYYFYQKAVKQGLSVKPGEENG